MQARLLLTPLRNRSGETQGYRTTPGTWRRRPPCPALVGTRRTHAGGGGCCSAPRRRRGGVAGSAGREAGRTVAPAAHGQPRPWLPPDEAYDRAQVRMARWLAEGCDNDAEVVRLVIEALQRELDAAGGPEDALAKVMLQYLIEIATAPSIEPVGLPRIPTAGPQRRQRLGASTSEAFEKGLPEMAGLCSDKSDHSFLRRAAVGSALRCPADPGPRRVSVISVAW